MEDFEKLLGIYFFSLFSESKRFIQYKSQSIALRALLGIKKVTLLCFLALISSTTVIAGLFFSLLQVISIFQKTGSLGFDSVVALSLGFVFIGALALFWSMQEQRWINAFGINDLVLLHEAGSGSVQSNKFKKSLGEGDLSKVLDKIVEDKLEELIERAVKNKS
jgi:hypothetical protein